MSYNYEQLYEDLTEVGVQSQLFKTVKRAMKQRGHWKNKPRGYYAKHGTTPMQDKLL